ncbi:MFS transporter [soil metagenome]
MPRFASRTFRSLKHRNYRLYFTGQIVSFTGSWMQSAALMWLVFDHTSNPLWPPLLLVAAVGPTLFLGPIGGALADRVPKRTLVMGTQAFFLLSAVTLAGLVAGNLFNPWLLFGVQLVNGIVQAIDLPARLAFVPELIPRVDLINAVGLNSLTFNAARAVGPALAGLLFLIADAVIAAGWLPHSRAVTLGALWCFLFNATSYAAVIWALSLIHIDRDPLLPKQAPGSFWDGFRFLRQHPGLAGIVVFTGLLSIFGWPVLTLLPAYTKFVLGQAEKSYSLLVSALGGGALIGSILTATYGSPKRKERFLLLGCFASLLGLIGLTVVNVMPLALGCCALFGFGLILYLSTGQSTMQLSSPDHARGKVMALWAMTLSGSSIPGHLLAGYAAQHYPVTDVMLAMTAGVAASTAGVVALVVSGKVK